MAVVVIRREQMEAFRTDARVRYRENLYFRMSTRNLPFGLESLGRQIDIGLREAARFHIRDERAITTFIETVLCSFGGFTLDADGNGVYPPKALRFLDARHVPDKNRIERLSQWAAKQSNHA
jgi:hypothetical protein